MLTVYEICKNCGGDGKITSGGTPAGPDGSCLHCSGTGYVDSGLRLDYSEFDDAVMDKLAEHTIALDYIHGKVTAIWNQVKPG